MSRKAAFTLIELLIVVAIIAILAAIAVPNFLEAQTRARVSRVQNDLRTIALALESYRVDNMGYPMYTPKNYNMWDRTPYDPTGTNTYDAVFPVLLTTPIAYLSSFAPDIFRVVAGIGNPNYPLYACAYVPTTNAYGYERMYNVYPRTGFLTWSWGPDKKQNSSSYCTAPYIVGNESLATPSLTKGIRYDPTNGTVSVGDIYRHGGDMLDHWR